MHWNDVRMQQPGGGARLSEEARDVGAVGEPVGDELDRDIALQALLTRAIDHAHAATTEFLDQLVIAELTLTWVGKIKFGPCRDSTASTGCERGARKMHKDRVG